MRENPIAAIISTAPHTATTRAAPCTIGEKITNRIP
jgi:hypothetical protein